MSAYNLNFEPIFFSFTEKFTQFAETQKEGTILKKLH